MSGDGDLAVLDGGVFVIGTDARSIPEDGEGPARSVEIAPFTIANTVVVNSGANDLLIYRLGPDGLPDPASKQMFFTGTDPVSFAPSTLKWNTR